MRTHSIARPMRLACAHRALAAALCTVAFGAAAQTPPPLTLDDAVQIASERSRQLVATDAQARAARERAIAAGQRPDPVLTLGVNNLPVDGPDAWSTSRDFMTMRSIGVMQTLTREEKRHARTARAEREADIATALGRQAGADLQRDAALAWLDRSYQQSIRDLLAAQVTEAARNATLAETFYRSGRGAQAEVFAAQAETEMMRDRVDEAERAVAVASAQLARWVGEAAIRPVGARPALVLPAWTEGDLATHLVSHPVIRTAAEQEALARADVAVARADQSSDWSVELMYSLRGSAYSNMMSINFAVPLQWDQKRRQDREVAAAQAQVERAAAEREDRLRAHEADVRAMLASWRLSAQRLARYDASLVPLAARSSEAALTAYRAGTGPLPAVLAARRAELESRTERLRIEMSLARLWAELNFLLPAGFDRTVAPGTRSQP